MVDKAVQAEAGYEGAGIARIASVGGPGVHAARGLIQLDIRNTVANGRVQ